MLRKFRKYILLPSSGPKYEWRVSDRTDVDIYPERWRHCAALRKGQHGTNPQDAKPPPQEKKHFEIYFTILLH
jgi:hypothetical protein